MAAVVGLVSGGKDSLFSLLHCLANGHRLVALANLTPQPNAQDGHYDHDRHDCNDHDGSEHSDNDHSSGDDDGHNDDELDSHMYQTVGHDAVPAIARALGLPLFRARLRRGRSLHTARDYAPQDPRDEVETLLHLLRRVRKRLPDVNAVAVGAILSDYQRVRVESVCTRLGLTVFAYLWQQPQEALVRALFRCDLHAVLVKVAAVGLDPHVHLGLPLNDIFPHLLRLHTRYDVHVAGEGGEYETITLDAPLFFHRLRLERSELVATPDGVGYLRLLNIATEPKPLPSRVLPPDALDDRRGDGGGVQLHQPLHETARAFVSSLVPTIDDLLGQWPAIQAAVHDARQTPSSALMQRSLTVSPTIGAATEPSQSIRQQPTVYRAEGFIWIDGVEADTMDGESGDNSVFAQTSAAFDRLMQLAGEAATVVAVGAWLHDMADFAAFNAAYGAYVPQTRPPVRVTVATRRLPSRRRVRLDALLVASTPAATAASTRWTWTHVQSVSNWAPANIGPYSQAASVAGLLLLAGQIPLIPGSMCLPSASDINDLGLAALAWRHVLAIVARHGHTAANIAAGIIFVRPDVEIAAIQRLWAHLWLHDGNDAPPLLCLRVDDLPRSAPVEWAMVACDPSSFDTTKTNVASEEEDDDDDDEPIDWAPQRLTVNHGNPANLYAHVVRRGPFVFAVIAVIDVADSTELHRVLGNYITAVDATPLRLQTFISSTRCKDPVEVIRTSATLASAHIVDDIILPNGTSVALAAYVWATCPHS